MRICYQGFFGNNHSWSYVSQNICRSLIELGHQVDIFSTNGNKYIPDNLQPYLIGYGEGKKILSGKLPDNNYDACLSYTALKNFQQYLQHSKKNRFGIWVYEFAGKNALPFGFGKGHLYCDQILTPSNFGKQIFMDSGIPESKITVLPHGVNKQEIDIAIPYKLKTNKLIKILINIGQVHRRKNLIGSLDIFGNAFNKNDDICLVIKVQDNQPKQQFELSFTNILNDFYRKFPNNAEVEVIRDFIPNIYSIYKSCNITFAASHTEGFGLVPFEGLSCGLLPVASNYGGFLDFLRDGENSLLINGKEFNVPPNHLYYQSRFGLKAFMPDIEDGVDKLRKAANMVSGGQLDGKKWSDEILENYSWNSVAEKIINICE